MTAAVMRMSSVLFILPLRLSTILETRMVATLLPMMAPMPIYPIMRSWIFFLKLISNLFNIAL
jgi:hypothetical protein